MTNSTMYKKEYSGEYVREMIEMVVAAYTANLNGMLISKPGFGKTDIVRHAGEAMVTPARFSKIGLTPGGSPKKIEGRENMRELFENRTYVMDYDGTPYDGNIDILLLDEVGRASDASLDALIQALDPDNQNHCVAIGTTNFVPTKERTEALLDRFALWFYIAPERLDIRAIVQSHMSTGNRPQLPIDVPTRDEILTVRGTKPSDRAIAAVADFVELVALEAMNGGFDVNPRWVTQLEKLIYFNTVRELGTGDFDHIPAAVRRLVRFAQVQPDADTARRWQELTESVYDPLGSAMDEILRDTAAACHTAANEENDDRRAMMMNDIMLKKTAAMKEIAELTGGKHTAEYQEVESKVLGWIAAIVRGEAIE